MPKRTKQTRKTYVTRKFVGDKINELARIVERVFRKVATKEDVKQFLTKGDAKQFLIKEDAKLFLTKEDAKQFLTKDYFDTKLEKFGKQLLHDFEIKLENREAELQGAHEDELAAIGGKKEAPLRWKSIPRRLKGVEQEVEKIKDHIQLP